MFNFVQFSIFVHFFNFCPISFFVHFLSNFHFYLYLSNFGRFFNFCPIFNFVSRDRLKLSILFFLIFHDFFLDSGTYRCQVNSGIDEVKLEAVFYNENDQNWLMILIIIIICILLLVLLTLCIICVRKRARRKGRYGVKDVADGKRTNR